MQFQLELKNQHQSLQSKGYFPYSELSLYNVQIHERGEIENWQLQVQGVMVGCVTVPGINMGLQNSVGVVLQCNKTCCFLLLSLSAAHLGSPRA